MNGGDTSNEKMARNSAGNVETSRVTNTIGMPLALAFRRESAKLAHSNPLPLPSCESLDALVSRMMMQQGLQACARLTAVDKSLDEGDEEDGGGSVMVVVKSPAASAADAANIILPQLVSQPLGFVMHTRT